MCLRAWMNFFVDEKKKMKKMFSIYVAHIIPYDYGFNEVYR